jgi:hypothetical protein
MYLAAQVLPQLVLPIGLTLLLAHRRPGAAPPLAGAARAGAAVGRQQRLTAQALWRVVEAGQERVLAADVPQADAIVVLSSRRRTAPGDAGVRGWDTAERFLAGLELVAAERAPGWCSPAAGRPGAPDAEPEGDVNRRDAIALGVHLSACSPPGASATPPRRPWPWRRSCATMASAAPTRAARAARHLRLPHAPLGGPLRARRVFASPPSPSTSGRTSGAASASATWCRAARPSPRPRPRCGSCTGGSCIGLGG